MDPHEWATTAQRVSDTDCAGHRGGHRRAGQAHPLPEVPEGCLMTGKRRFGRVRQLPSGRWQARYKGPDGIDRPAPSTFATKRAAEVWLTKIEVDVLAGQWLNPDAGAVPFGEYAPSWIEERPGLRPKTIQLYRYLLRRHLLPAFAAWPVCDIREPHVRRWRKQLLDAGTSPVTVAKAYQLLKAIMNTAADDGLITRNPCRIKGAGQERSPERPVLTVAQVFTLADAINPGTGRWCCWQCLRACGGVNWQRFAAATSTSTPRPSGSYVNSPRYAAEDSPSARLSLRPGNALSSCPPSSSPTWRGISPGSQPHKMTHCCSPAQQVYRYGTAASATVTGYLLWPKPG